ncbi:hypothetical protein JCM8547_006669 [Rhodosporidiobolus lusitaniae]
MFSAIRTVRQVARPLTRQLHASSSRTAQSNMLMPAMSPTMTEGSLSEWKVKEGDAFSAGDVLLSIETDKASIDVEAQDDGVMGKILVENGTAGVQVGKLIAILLEEGDDASSITVPSDADASASSSSSSASAPAPESAPTAAAPADSPTPSPATPSATPSEIHAHPHHSKPLLPSVLRLLAMNNVSDASSIKATGHNGILTKGDVLAFLGKIENARGSLPAEKPHGGHPANEYTKSNSAYGSSAGQGKKVPEVQLDGPSIRHLIAQGLSVAAKPKPAVSAPAPKYSFDSILDDYLPPSQRSSFLSSSSASTVVPPPKAGKNAFDDILGL